jgi:hypothetical protein
MLLQQHFWVGTRSYGGSQNPLGQRPLECAEALAPKQGRVGGHMMQGRVCGLIRMREGASPDGRGRFPARGALRLAPGLQGHAQIGPCLQMAFTKSYAKTEKCLEN